MPRRLFITFVVVIVALLGGFAVWYFSHEIPSGRSSPALVIGAILPLTGDGSEFGKDGLVGAQIAADELNFGQADSVELLVEDSRTQPKDGVSAYQRLMAMNRRPNALISTMSSVCSALVPLVERDHLPLFCIAAAPALTQDNNFVFRALPTADYQARTLLSLTGPRFNYKSLGILFVNDEFGSSMESALRSEAGKRGLSVSSEGVQASASDFRAALNRLLSTTPDAVFIAAFGSTLGSAVKQLREQSFSGILLCPLEIGYPKVLEVAGQAAEQAIFVDTKFDVNSDDPETRRFVSEFMKRTARKPSLDAVLTQDEVKLLHQVASKGDSSPGSIREGLLRVSGYQSINGAASMLPNGDLAYELQLKQIRAGKAVPF